VARELIKPAEYARRRGVSKAAVSFAIKRCAIPLVDGKLDPLVADTLWKARTDPLQSQRALGANVHRRQPDGRQSQDGDPDWRARREAAEAQIAEIELQRLAGKLIEAEAAKREWSRRQSALIAGLMAIPDRISAEFGVDDAHRRTIRLRLIEEIDAVRRETVVAFRGSEQ
jgi:hypothetical protein